MRVLVVEDEEQLAHMIARELREQASFAVDVSTNGEDGLHMAETVPYDLLLLDLMLPKISGLQILKHLRVKGVQIPILVLTARHAAEDIVAALNLGCDDYLPKPFNLDELIARCQALIRRSYRHPNPSVQVGGIVIDSVSRSVQVQGQPVKLTAMEYRLLEYLARRQGEVVSKSELIEHLYDFGTENMSNVVEVYISSLRRKLQREPSRHLIQTQRGLGYILKALPE